MSEGKPAGHDAARDGELGQAARLSEELESLLAIAPGRPMKLRTIVEHLHFRGLPALIVLLCVPFLFPVSIPGLSIPFGAAIALCGFRLGVGHSLWMPDFLLRREISYDLLQKLVGSAAAFYRRVEKLVRPRMHFLQRWPGMINLMGFMIMIGGILLSLPIPPPFPLTNSIPGLAIIFMALGIMERDGVCTLIGYALAVVGLFYIGLIFFLGAAGAQHAWDWMAGR
ncbi:MAG: exopolysaccharide biosynthesis protein [Chthoniobacterales bacterium]|nr:exopolysaccharide biosynthesis protein [Chthoniobacterales bacterium]